MTHRHDSLIRQTERDIHVRGNFILKMERYQRLKVDVQDKVSEARSQNPQDSSKLDQSYAATRHFHVVAAKRKFQNHTGTNTCFVGR